MTASRSASEARTSITCNSTSRWRSWLEERHSSTWCRRRTSWRRTRAAGRTTPRARSAGSSRTCTTWAACPTTGSAPGCGRSSKRTACRLDTVVATTKPTTLALVDLDADGAATYRFYTEGTSAPALTPEAALAALPADVDFLHVGTLGLVMEPIASALQAVVEAVADRALIMVDPNCRPTFIADRDAYRASLANDAAPRARGEGQRGRPRVPVTRRRPGRGRAGARRAGRAGHARGRRRADRHRRRRGAGGRAEDHGRGHDRRRRRVRRRLLDLLGARGAQP